MPSDSDPSSAFAIIRRALIVAALSLASFSNLVAAPPPRIQVLTRNFEEIHRFYGMRFKYPQIAGAPRFNARVQEVVRDATGKFRQEMGIVLEKPQYDGYIDGKYKAAVLTNGIVSVLLEWSEYFPGAAHPGGTSVSVNYDSKTGKILKLSDLFRSDADYVSQLSKLAMTDLIGREIAEPMVIEHGAGPVEANFQVFTLTDTLYHPPFPDIPSGRWGSGPPGCGDSSERYSASPQSRYCAPFRAVAQP